MLIDHLTLSEVLELATVFVAVVTHTAVLFRWGGKVNQLLEGHEQRLVRLENIQDRRMQ